MSSDVWFGAALSVPIGIVTGLAVVPVQKWIENRGKAKALIDTRDAKERYVAVLFYRLHPHLFTQYLLRTVIQTTFTGAGIGIVAGFIYALSSLVGGIGHFISVLGQITAIVGSVLIINYCRPALKLWNQVRDFEEYVKTVPADARLPDAEAQAEQVKEHLL